MTGIGQRIKEARNILGITQTELANRLGLISKSTICKIENGEDNLTVETIARYAKALEVSMAFLMGTEGAETVTIEVAQEELDNIQNALKLYSEYKSSPCEIQAAIDLILKSVNSEK